MYCNVDVVVVGQMLRNMCANALKMRKINFLQPEDSLRIGRGKKNATDRSGMGPKTTALSTELHGRA